MAVTHLSHVELSCRDVDASAEFLGDIFGLHEVARADGSVYLRCWGDWQGHSIILSPGAEPGARHICWNVSADTDLAAIAGGLEEREIETWWEEDEPRQDRALRFRAGDGLVHELLVDERRTPITAVTSRLHAQPLPLRGVGIEPRRLDHCHIGTPCFEQVSGVMSELLGFRIREKVNTDDGAELTHFMSVDSQVHDIALRRAPEFDFHHIALWLDTREQMLRAAELIVHRGFRTQVGPGQHASTQAFFCHTIEPSGNRIELFAAQYIVYEDWVPQEWSVAQKIEIERALGFCPSDLHAAERNRVMAR